MPKMPAPRPPIKKAHFVPIEKNKMETSIPDDETTSSAQPVKAPARSSISPPFDRYIDKTWFPQGLNYDVRKTAMALIPILDAEKPFVLKEIYSFLGQLHKYVTFMNDQLPHDVRTMLVDVLMS